MSMLEDEILGALPVELYPFATIGDLPGTNPNHISIMLYDGSYNTEYFGKREDSTLYNPLIKIVVRNSSYEQANEWSKQIRDALHRYSGGNILSSFLVGFPMYLGWDAQKLHNFQLTFMITSKE